MERAKNHSAGLPAGQAGFTLVELIIVMAIMSFLLALSAPMVEAARSDISMNRTLRFVKTDLITGMGYALAGKSIGAFSANDLSDIHQIPETYALYFQKSSDSTDPKYYYVELVPVEGKSGEVSVNYQVEKEWPSSAVALTDIRLTDGGTDPGRSVEQALIFFTSPFGKINFIADPGQLFVPGGTMNLAEAFKNESDTKQIELDFQFQDNELSESTLTLNTDKTISIL